MSERVNAYLGFFAGTLVITAALFLIFRFARSMESFFAYLLAINLACFLVFGYDKTCARSKLARMPEFGLYMAALAGGTAGILIGMPVFRHKTRKPHFQLVMVVILLIQIVLFGSIHRSSG